MTKTFKVKIPKGTLIDIDENSYLLKKSIYAQSDGDKIVLTGDQITTDLFSIERRHITPSSIPRITDKRDKKEISNELHETAFKILTSDIRDKELREKALIYLKKIFDNEIGGEEYLEEPKPDDSSGK